MARQAENISVWWCHHGFFFWNRDVKPSGTHAAASQNIKRAIRYLFISKKYQEPLIQGTGSLALAGKFILTIILEELLVFAKLSYRCIPMCDCSELSTCTGKWKGNVKLLSHFPLSNFGLSSRYIFPKYFFPDVKAICSFQVSFLSIITLNSVFSVWDSLFDSPSIDQVISLSVCLFLVISI